jgi:hypothetical protein
MISGIERMKIVEVPSWLPMLTRQLIVKLPMQHARRPDGA